MSDASDCTGARIEHSRSADCVHPLRAGSCRAVLVITQWGAAIVGQLGRHGRQWSPGSWKSGAYEHRHALGPSLWGRGCCSMASSRAKVVPWAFWQAGGAKNGRDAMIRTPFTFVRVCHVSSRSAGDFCRNTVDGTVCAEKIVGSPYHGRSFLFTVSAHSLRACESRQYPLVRLARKDRNARPGSRMTCQGGRD